MGCVLKGCAVHTNGRLSRSCLLLTMLYRAKVLLKISTKNGNYWKLVIKINTVTAYCFSFY